jgi:hypothetical protein
MEHYPGWTLQYGLPRTLREMVDAQLARTEA